MKRLIYLAPVMVLLTGCAFSERHQKAAPGPLGIDGDGWFLLILFGLFVLWMIFSDRGDRRG